MEDKKEKINDEQIEKQIGDISSSQRKYLCRRFLKTKGGQEAFKDLKGKQAINEIKETKLGWGFFIFVVLFLWFISGIVYTDINPAKSVENVKHISSYLQKVFFSSVITYLSVLVLTEICFFYRLFKNKRAELIKIKQAKGFSSKIVSIIYKKLFALIWGFSFFVIFIIGLVFLLLPLPLVMPGLIMIELYIRNNPGRILIIAIGALLYIFINYIITVKLSRNDDNIKKEFSDDDVIAALKSNPNVEVLDLNGNKE